MLGTTIQLIADNWKHSNSLVPVSSKALPIDKIIWDHYLLSYNGQEQKKIMEKAPWSHNIPFSYGNGTPLKARFQKLTKQLFKSTYVNLIL